jgi:hypothetical protein
MRRIILIAFMLMGYAYAQYTPMTAAGYQFKRIVADSTLHLPSFCGIPTLRNSSLKNGALAIDTCGQKVYFWTNGGGWAEVTGTALDTTSLSNRINLKLAISDTTNKWVNNVTKKNDSTITIFKGNSATDITLPKGSGGGASQNLQQVTDIGNTTTNIIYTGNVIATDKQGGEAPIVAVYNSTDGNSILGISDTKIGGFNSVVFTNTLSGNRSYYLPDNSGTFALSVNGNYADDFGNITLSTGSGTVTSVATGYGLSGGTITTSGTLLVDTATLSTKYARLGETQNGRFGNDTASIVMAKVHNDAGVQLTNGKVIYLSSSGTSSDVPSVKLANNKGDSTSANTFGFVSGTIAINDTGWVILSGKIEKLNTSAFANGDIIYLDSVSGNYTKTKPSAPYHMVYLGVVVKANAGNGSIFVKCQNGYELDEIHDVAISGKVNNNILVYSDTQKVWKNRSIYSVVDTTNKIATKTNVAAKVNISDTANMLSKYQLKNIPSVAYLGSDFNTTSTTAANSNLSIAVLANTAYRIMISGSASKAISSTGMKISIGAPTGTTIKALAALGGNAISTITNSFISSINTLGSTFATGVGVEVPFRVEGILVTGANAGNIVLQAATVTSNTATIYANTLMTITPSYAQ